MLHHHRGSLRAAVLLLVGLAPLVALFWGDLATAGKPDFRPKVTAKQARAKGLPALGFTLTLRQGGWSASLLPEPGCYLRLSGPPGGPLLIEVWDYPNPKASGASLARWVQGHFGKPYHRPVQAASPTTFNLLGAPRQAVAVTTGTSLARTGWCAVLASSPLPNPREFVVLFAHGAGAGQSPTCAQIAAHPWIAQALPTLRVLP
jgi:hypothetical protein